MNKQVTLLALLIISSNCLLSQDFQFKWKAEISLNINSYTVKVEASKEKRFIQIKEYGSKDSIIKRINKTDCDSLVNILRNDENSSNRGYAAAILGDLRDSTAIPALEEALKNRDRNVGIDAAQALQKITGKKYEWEKK